MSPFASAAGASYWHACPKGQVVGRHRLFCYAEFVSGRACETLSLTSEWGDSDLEAGTTGARSVVYRRRAVHLRTIEPRGPQCAQAHSISGSELAGTTHKHNKEVSVLKEGPCRLGALNLAQASLIYDSVTSG